MLRRLVPLLLVTSGAAALVYQIGWLRELRLLFGSSTPATATVLAIFMGGLGLGGAVIGPRADRHPRPVRLYGYLELGIALWAAATPWILWLVRSLYVATGGIATLGSLGATATRLFLSVLVLGGADLPDGRYAAGGLSSRRRSRRSGSSVECAALWLELRWVPLAAFLLANFLLLEHLGTRATLLVAAAANGVVAVVALAVSARRQHAAAEPAPPLAESREEAAPPVMAPTALVKATGFVVGMVFMALELLWYRMLTPLLGGTTYSFGLVLAAALAGIGIGGLVYSLRGRTLRPTLRGLAISLALEAACIAIPLVLGDFIAVLALGLWPIGDIGFPVMVVVWAVIAVIVVLPAALVSGFQFSNVGGTPRYRSSGSRQGYRAPVRVEHGRRNSRRSGRRFRSTARPRCCRFVASPCAAAGVGVRHRSAGIVANGTTYPPWCSR